MLRNEKGNVALMTALMMLPIMALLGATVDFARYVTYRTEMESAVESAVLAAASLTQTRDSDTVVREFISKQIDNSQYEAAVAIEVLNDTGSLTNRTITVRASGTYETFFLSLLGIDDMKVTSVATATQKASSLEIALVLDVSGSMAGSKISDLHDAASDFVDAIYEGSDPDLTSMSIIPFSSSVNIAPIWDDFVFSMTDPSVTVDPGASEYNIRYSVPESNFRFNSPVSSKCLELKNSDFNTLDLLPANSRSERRLHEHDYEVWYCPRYNERVLFNENSPSTLKSKINSLRADGYTAINEGAYWGAVSLSPDWKGKLGGDFSDRPGEYDSGGFKILVIMSDGDIQKQGRRPELLERTEPVCERYDYVYYPSKKKKKKKKGGGGGTWKYECVEFSYVTVVEANGTQTVRDDGYASDSTTTSTASGQLKRVCDKAKEEGIIVFTIGFEVPAGGEADEILEYCATAPTNYYLIEPGFEISEAFEAIAAAVTALRISG